jgi:hypothetical protein
MNKYKADFAVSPANESNAIIAWVNKILMNERNIKISSTPLETAEIFVENIRWFLYFMKVVLLSICFIR